MFQPLTRLFHPDPTKRLADALTGLGSNAEKQQRKGAATLSAIGDPAVPALVAAIRGDARAEREWDQAISELSALDAEAKSRILRVVYDLAGADAKSRAGATSLLAKTPPDFARAVTSLAVLYAARESARRRRKAALQVLADMLPRSASHNDILSVLVSALTDGECGTQARSLLKSIGQEAVPVLVAALSHTEYAPDAARLLKEIGVGDSTFAVPIARAAAAHDGVRAVLLAVLEGMEDRAADAVPILLGSAAANNWDCAGTIAAIGKKRVADLAAGLGERNDRLRLLCVRSLGQMGQAASSAAPAMCRTLEGATGDLLAAVVAALGRIGANTAEPVPRLLALARGGNAALADAAIRTLGALGRAARDAAPALLQMFRDKPSQALANTLASIGETQAAEPLVRLVFTTASGDWLRALEKLAPYSSITPEVARWTADAGGYEHKYRGWKYDAGYISLDKSDDAIKRLCQLNTPATSNILHLVAAKQDVSVTMDTGCSPAWQEKVSFERQRQAALDELTRRGNPPYCPENYQPGSAEQEVAARAGAAAVRQRQHEERFRELARLIQNPRGDLGETKWQYYEELARDHRTEASFRIIAADLARLRQIPLGDLNRFEGLLMTIGREIGENVTAGLLGGVRVAWPRTADAILSRLKA